MYPKNRAALFCAATLSLGAAEAASLTGSTAGFHYFYKPGASVEEHDEAVLSCIVWTRALSQPSTDSSAAAASGGFIGALVAGLVAGVIDSYEERQGSAANIEGCMAVGGWSVVGLSAGQGSALDGDDNTAAVREKIAPLVGATSPQGPVLRGPFANEMAQGDFNIGPAQNLDEISFSVRAVRDLAKEHLDAAGDLKEPKPPKGSAKIKQPKALKQAELAGAAPQKSYLVIRVDGVSGRVKGPNFYLERLAPDGTEIVYDGAPATISLTGAKTNEIKGEDRRTRDTVIEIAPGLWKLSGIGMVTYPKSFSVDFCFGAPAFEVAEGDVVFLGRLDVSGGGGYPLVADDIAVAREILAANPALAEKAESASYTNGFTSDCFGVYAYAYEIPGAPFVDMTALARSTPAVDAAPVEDANGVGAKTPSEDLIEAPVTESAPSAPPPEPDAAASDTIPSEAGAEQ